MQAVCLTNGRFTYQPNYPKPIPKADEALIRITLAGICSTDLELIKGYKQFEGVLGHEFVGIVEEATTEWIGKRVVGTINLGCRSCKACLIDGPKHCPQRTVLGIMNKDGTFADYATLPLANLLPVPDDVTDETAVFTEPLAAALRIREQLIIPPAAKIAIVGPGRLGLLVGQVMALGGTAVTLLGRRQSSLKLPAKLGLNVGLANDFADNSFDFVVEATGNEAGFAHSVRLVRPRGTLLLKSTFHGLAKADLSQLVVDEINLIGSRCGPFAPAVRLLSQNAIDVLSTVEKEYRLADAAEAFTHAAQPGTRKILLRP